MKLTYATSARRPEPELGLRVARLVVTLYFAACALHGVWLLRQGGLTLEAGQRVFHLWFVEALVFLAGWGVLAFAVAMLRGGARDPRSRAREAPVGRTLRIGRDRAR